MSTIQGFICPVCGQHTFERLGDYEICPLCGWENDRIQFEDPEFAGGANALSLNEYRADYLENVNPADDEIEFTGYAGGEEP